MSSPFNKNKTNRRNMSPQDSSVKSPNAKGCCVNSGNCENENKIFFARGLIVKDLNRNYRTEFDEPIKNKPKTQKDEKLVSDIHSSQSNETQKRIGQYALIRRYFFKKTRQKNGQNHSRYGQRN